MLAASALSFARNLAAPRGTGLVMYADASLGAVTSITSYVQELEGKAHTLSAKLGLHEPRPRCIGDECLTMESYIDLLEQSVSNMQAQWDASDGDDASGTTMTYGTPDASLSMYLSTLEDKVQVLSNRFGVPMPQQCDDESCMPLQSYIDLLEETYATLEAQWDKPESSSGWGDEYTGATVTSALTTTAYLQELERRVQMAAQRTGIQPPSQCDEESCLDLQSYIDLLEEYLVKSSEM
jgi:hypothetical protein